MTEAHKKELSVLRETHEVKRLFTAKQHETRRRNFQNTVLAEERKVRFATLISSPFRSLSAMKSLSSYFHSSKVRMQCRKMAIMRSRKDYEEERKEELRQKRLMSKSEGLKNVSKNVYGLGFDDEERRQVR